MSHLNNYPYARLLSEACSVPAILLKQPLLTYLTKDMQPVYTVEKSGFKLLVSKQNPQYNLPPRNHFTEVEIPKLYVEVRDTVVKPKLAEVEFFSAKTDLWTSQAKQIIVRILLRIL